MLRSASASLLKGARPYGVAAASAAPKVAATPELSSTKLANGVQIASYENHGPVSSLSFVVAASSRFETSETLGNSHFLRLFGFKGVKGRTHLKLVRELDLQGGNLTISANREHIVYNAVFLRDELPEVVDLLSGIFTKPSFLLHELDEVREVVESDLAQIQSSPETIILEALHKAAFRRGLGNGLYAPQVNLERIDSSTLQQYAAKHFVSSNIAIVGSGVNLHDLEHLAADHLKVSSGKVAPIPTTYFGGEVYQGRFDENSRVAVAFETKGILDKDFYSTSLLQKVLGGSQSSVSYGSGRSLLAQAAGSNASIESFNLSYSDAGLIGFLITAPHGSGVGEAHKGSLASIQKLAQGVSEQDLARAKNQLKIEYLQSFDSRHALAQNLGKQLLTTGKTFTGADFTSNIEKITPSDVQRVASRLAQSKATVIVAADDF